MQKDLQIAEIFSSMDSKNEGKINKGQIRGLISVYGNQQKKGNVDESVKALMRRFGERQEAEISF